MRVHPLIAPAIVIIVLLGSVQLADRVGWWQTLGQQVIDLNNMTADDLRGWITLQQISDGLDIPLEELYGVLGLPADTHPSSQMKDIEAFVEVSTARTLLADYLSRRESGAVAPAPSATPTPAPTESETPQATLPQTEDGGKGPTPPPAGQLRPEDIKGRMTLREVSQGTGFPLEEILREANLPANTSPNLALKDLAAQIEGFEVETVREAVIRLSNR